MAIIAERIAALAEGTLFQFSDWPNPDVPTFGAGVYTIWHRDGRFIYAGMSGRSISEQTKPRNTPHGIYTRLASHAAGRRSGDQFCVYVADRLVLPSLTADDISGIVDGKHQMDAHVRRYVHSHLLYRYVIVENGKAALAIEKRIKSGDWGQGHPLLNPTRR